MTLHFVIKMFAMNRMEILYFQFYNFLLEIYTCVRMDKLPRTDIPDPFSDKSKAAKAFPSLVSLLYTILVVHCILIR